MEKLIIKNIICEPVEITDLDAAIAECRKLMDSPYKMLSGYTVGEDHAFMLTQLTDIKQRRNRERLTSSAKEQIDNGKRLTKLQMASEIGRCSAYHPASIYWPDMKRSYMVKKFNEIFGTEIE